MTSTRQGLPLVAQVAEYQQPAALAFPQEFVVEAVFVPCLDLVQEAAHRGESDPAILWVIKTPPATLCCVMFRNG